MRQLWPAILTLTIVVMPVEASTPVVDGHNHEGLSAADGVIDTSKLDELKGRGIEAVVVPLPIDRSKTSDLPARIAAEMESLRRMSSTDAGFTITEDPGKLLSDLPDGNIQLLFSIEWFHTIFDGDPGLVQHYKELGVRVIGFAQEDRDGLFETDNGTPALSPFGKKIVHAMNISNVLIDITHLTHEQKLEVIAGSSAPVVASHSLVQAATPARFNLPDTVLTALAENGGSVWVSFQKSDLLGDAVESHAVDRLIDHIDVLVARLGPGHVGIGTDLQAGGRYVPETLNQPGTFTKIGNRLRQRGYTEENINAILGGNVLRILADPVQ